MSGTPTPAGAPVLVVVGPTSAGKTELAMRLAEPLGGEIVSADSRQIYQGLDVGTGKPSAEQLQRVPHHLVSSEPPGRVMTAALFAEQADAACREITARGQRVLLVGGTGLWIRAFMDGLAPTSPPDPGVRAQLAARMQAEGRDALHAELARVDPETAARLHPADWIRVIRALEIYHTSGRPASAWPKIAGPARPGVWLGVTRPRAELYARAEARIDEWLAAGWVQEVETLLAGGLAPETPAMQALGYSHLVRYVRGEWPLARAVELIKRDTRRYIKRQLTWFLADSRIRWTDASGGLDAALDSLAAASREAEE